MKYKVEIEIDAVQFKVENILEAIMFTADYGFITYDNNGKRFMYYDDDGDKNELNEGDWMIIEENEDAGDVWRVIKIYSEKDFESKYKIIKDDDKKNDLKQEEVGWKCKETGTIVDAIQFTEQFREEINNNLLRYDISISQKVSKGQFAVYRLNKFPLYDNLIGYINETDWLVFHPKNNIYHVLFYNDLSFNESHEKIRP